MASLALLGFDVHGIDVSGDVAGRAKNYLKEVNAFQPISASVEVADIFSYEASHETYDMQGYFILKIALSVSRPNLQSRSA